MSNKQFLEQNCFKESLKNDDLKKKKNVFLEKLKKRHLRKRTTGKLRLEKKNITQLKNGVKKKM